MLQAAAPSILVVGAGLTGAATCRALCRLLPPDSTVECWEALDVIGGRFHTEVTGDGGACDTGAQYVTVTDDAEVAAAHAPLYAELTAAGVLAPLRGRIEGGRAADGGGANYVAPAGLSTVVSHLFASARQAPTRSRRAVRLTPADGAWDVAASDGHAKRFDGVVLTQPLPEMLELLDTGAAGAWLATEPPSAAADVASPLRRADLLAVQYSSRYALTLFFPPAAASAFSAQIDWVARYVQKAEDDAIVYIGHDSAKRLGGTADAGGAAAAPVSLIVHTYVPYGLKRIAAGATEEEVAADLIARTRRLLPWLPEASSSVLRTWRVSQVRTPLALPAAGGEADGAARPVACWPLAPPPATGSAAPPIVLAGDAFSPLGSRFDGCMQSGEDAAAAMARALGGV
jgi:renalase